MATTLLGLNGSRYLTFRATVRETRAGTAITSREALAAFAFTIDARISLQLDQVAVCLAAEMG